MVGEEPLPDLSKLDVYDKLHLLILFDRGFYYVNSVKNETASTEHYVVRFYEALKNKELADVVVSPNSVVKLYHLTDKGEMLFISQLPEFFETLPVYWYRELVHPGDVLVDHNGVMFKGRPVTYVESPIGDEKDSFLVKDADGLVHKVQWTNCYSTLSLRLPQGVDGVRFALSRFSLVNKEALVKTLQQVFGEDQLFLFSALQKLMSRKLFSARADQEDRVKEGTTL